MEGIFLPPNFDVTRSRKWWAEAESYFQLPHDRKKDWYETSNQVWGSTIAVNQNDVQWISENIVYGLTYRKKTNSFENFKTLIKIDQPLYQMALTQSFMVLRGEKDLFFIDEVGQGRKVSLGDTLKQVVINPYDDQQCLILGSELIQLQGDVENTLCDANSVSQVEVGFHPSVLFLRNSSSLLGLDFRSGSKFLRIKGRFDAFTYNGEIALIDPSGAYLLYDLRHTLKPVYRYPVHSEFPIQQLLPNGLAWSQNQAFYLEQPKMNAFENLVRSCVGSRMSEYSAEVIGHGEQVAGVVQIANQAIVAEKSGRLWATGLNKPEPSFLSLQKNIRTTKVSMPAEIQKKICSYNVTDYLTELLEAPEAQFDAKQSEMDSKSNESDFSDISDD